MRTGAPTQTLVSAVFDLERRGEPRPRPLASYLEKAAYVLGLDLPLVVFADPGLDASIRQQRAARGLEQQTHVVPRTLEELPAYARLPSVAGLPTFLNANPHGDRPLFQILNWSKVDLLTEAAALNPFRTDHFAWIDLAIAHVAVPPVRFPDPSDRVAVLEMVAVAPVELADRREFYAYERGRLAGGCLRAHRSALSQLTHRFHTELDEAIGSGWRPNEQQVLSALSVMQPDLFAPYFGDYASILCNWDAIRRDTATVRLNLHQCARFRLWSRAIEILRRMTESVDSGALTVDAGLRADWTEAVGWLAGSPAAGAGDRLVRRLA